MDSIKLPRISSKFYEVLEYTFPALRPADITSSTTMIDIQRNAAQQEVLDFIKRSVREDGTEPTISMYNRIRNKLGI